MSSSSMNMLAETMVSAHHLRSITRLRSHEGVTSIAELRTGRAGPTVG
jgi:hypothetical protein